MAGQNIKIRLKENLPIGIFNKIMSIKHNIQTLDPIKIIISGEIYGDITLSKNKIYIFGNNADEPLENEIYLIKNRKPNLVIKEIRSFDSNVIVSHHEIIKGIKYKLHVKVDMPLGACRFNSKLRVSTNNKYQPIIDIPIISIVRKAKPKKPTIIK